MVTILVGPQFLVVSPKVQSLVHCSFCYMLMISHYLWIAPYCHLLMMPRFFDELEVKLITCNFNGILICHMNGQTPGYLVLILACYTLQLGRTHSYGDYYMNGNVANNIIFY